MNQTAKNPTIGLIAIFETILLFILGVLGNKLSESLQITPGLLLSLVSFVLGILAIVSYRKVNLIQNESPQEIPFLKRIIPRTMAGIFPFSLFLGLLIGLLIPADVTSYINLPLWMSKLIGSNIPISLMGGEVAGVLGGIFALSLFAMIIDGHLAAALCFGYGLSFATAIVVRLPLGISDILLTYFGHGISFVTVAIFLFLMEPMLNRLRKLITEPRL